MLTIAVAETPPELRIQLQPGTLLRGRVVDEEGHPVAGAIVRSFAWRGWPIRAWNSLTDEEGRFQWNSAPHAEVTLAIERSGFATRTDVVLTATPDEETIALQRARVLNVFGTVSEAETGDPVAEFTVYSERPTLMRLSCEQVEDKQGMAYHDGHYRFPFRSRADDVPVAVYVGDTAMIVAQERVLWIVAQGFGPQRLALPETTSAEYELDVRLQRSGGVRAVVRQPDGAPAAGAQVTIGLPGTAVQFALDGDARPTSRLQAPTITTDGGGGLCYRTQCEPYTLVAVHKLGYAEVSDTEIAASREITLQAWGRLEGACEIGPRNGAFEKFRLTYVAPAQLDADRTRPLVTATGVVMADAQGRFTFECLPPGRARLNRMLDARYDGDVMGPEFHARDISIVSGQTSHVAVRREGRPLVGRVIAVTGTDQPLSAYCFIGTLDQVLPARPERWDKMSPADQEAWLAENNGASLDIVRWPGAGNESDRGVRRYRLVFTNDTSFAVDDVAPGTYQLYLGSALKGARRRSSPLVGQITVLPADDPKNPMPFDAGGFTVGPPCE
jgi:hypothetical protein